MVRVRYILACICFGVTAGAFAAAPPRGGTRPATRGAAAVPVVPVAAPAAEEVAGFYQSTVQRYLTGEWAGLVEEITGHLRLQNALSKEQQADITYIKN